MTCSAKESCFEHGSRGGGGEETGHDLTGESSEVCGSSAQFPEGFQTTLAADIAESWEGSPIRPLPC